MCREGMCIYDDINNPIPSEGKWKILVGLVVVKQWKVSNDLLLTL